MYVWDKFSNIINHIYICTLNILCQLKRERNIHLLHVSVIYDINIISLNLNKFVKKIIFIYYKNIIA